MSSGMGQAEARLAAIARDLAAGDVLVVGDVISDRYQFGRPARVSREAPVLILEYTAESANPGGAANAAANIRSLGGRVRLLGLVGDDPAGEGLSEQLRTIGVDPANLVVEPGRRTTSKTRIYAGSLNRGQQVVRLDTATEAPPGPRARRELRDRARRLLDGAGALLVSDYGYGAVDGWVGRTLVAEARKRGLPVVVDSQGDLGAFRQATLMTPNQAELERWAGRRLGRTAEVEDAARRLLRRSGAAEVLCTRGSEGMCLVGATSSWDIPLARRIEVFDVAGAGDTVAAAMALGAATAARSPLAALVAACAASVVVQKHGAATCSQEELAEAIRSVDPAAVRAVGL